MGGVGGYFGGLLAKNREDVTFVARGAHLDALQRDGLSLETVEGAFENLPVKAVGAIKELRDPQVVLLATKTYDRDTAAQELAGVASPSTVIIPLQNGIDNDLAVKRWVPQAQVYPGLAYIVSAIAAPGRIRQTAGERTILFGERGNRVNALLREVESIMKSAGILANASENIERDTWVKFLWIASFAGMTSLCRSPAGPIVADPEALAVYLRCVDEGIAVARACDIAIDDSVRERFLEKIEHFRVAGANAKSSLLVDLENRRRTEIESLNGALVRLAKERGVSVPTHDAIVAAVRVAAASF